ncbi:hypothetical protein B0H14DRAFT_918855 [Mycena olivaceomarginata]|nr:hypothetical protein B0H14DRAFT_918855 [Mycena olivaceomarginata]
MPLSHFLSTDLYVRRQRRKSGSPGAGATHHPYAQAWTGQVDDSGNRARSQDDSTGGLMLDPASIRGHDFDGVPKAISALALPSPLSVDADDIASHSVRARATEADSPGELNSPPSSDGSQPDFVMRRLNNGTDSSGQMTDTVGNGILASEPVSAVMTQIQRSATLAVDDVQNAMRESGASPACPSAQPKSCDTESGSGLGSTVSPYIKGVVAPALVGVGDLANEAGRISPDIDDNLPWTPASGFPLTPKSGGADFGSAFW